jgi:cardiolipin synthase
MRWFVLSALLGIASACGPETEAVDLCQAAADHRAACLGDYVTPPVCDAQTEEQARALLAMGCDEIARLGGDGKADGAWCDWIGAGCTPDEAIFTGPRCTRASDCASGHACLEGRCFAGVDSPAMDAMMDTWTASTATSGSATHLLVDNDETRRLRNDMMARAQRSIHFTALVLEPDTTGNETADHLIAAARRGVEVRVVVDATTQYTFASYDILRRLSAAGVEVIPFNPITEWLGVRGAIGINANQRLHEKLLIVDGTRAVIGGRNVGDDYLLDDKWRDTCVYVEGPGVASVQRMFLSIWTQIAGWERQAGCPQQRKYGFACPAAGDPRVDDPVYTPATPIAGTSRTRPIYSDPRAQRTPFGYRATLNLVRSARTSIYIANSYFVPPRRLRKHLKAAVARGVRVVVVTNSLESTDAWWMYYASLNYYKELIGAGVEVYHYRGTETMHAKTMLVDGKVALVGSFNLDPRSAASNSEAILLVRDGEAVAELSDAFAADLAYSDLADDDISAAEWVKAKAFRLVEPLL